MSDNLFIPRNLFVFSVGFLFILCSYAKQAFSVLLKEKHKIKSFPGLTEQAE